MPTINDGLIFNDAAAQVVTTIAQEPTTAVDLAKEIRERRNARERQAYAARVVIAQEEAERITSETAAAWRRAHLAEGRRDRYQKKKNAKATASPSGPTESSLSSSSSGT